MAEKTFRFLIQGGKATAGPPIGSSLGPLGFNVMQVVDKINEATKEFMGMRISVDVSVETDTKEFAVKVGTPSTAALIAKEIGMEKGSAKPGVEYVGNLGMGSVVRIASVKMSDMRARTLKAAVKQVLGTCVSMGVKVEERPAKDILREVEEGRFEALLGGRP